MIETAATPGGGRGRFAPSPTGFLHLGNARTALLAWARARSQGASFVLRVEDLDGPRTVAEAVDGNLAELRWLGLDWDEGPDVGGPLGPYRQSERSDRYERALATLDAAGRLARCYLSRRDLRELASAPQAGAGARGPVYGAAERARNAAVAPERAAAGQPASLRVRCEPGTLELRDALHGVVRFDAERDVGDVVVRRSDGLWAYALAVVVDDAAMGVEEVVRGDDLLPASGAQRMLAEALGLPAPRYLHVPLLLDEAGERLAKRRGDRTLRALRAAGVDPARVRGALWASAGLIDAPAPLSVAETLARFDLARLRRGGARWTPELEAALWAA